MNKNKELFEQVHLLLKKHFVEYQMDDKDPNCDSFFFIGVIVEKDSPMQTIKTGLAGSGITLSGGLTCAMEKNIDACSMLVSAVFRHVGKELVNDPLAIMMVKTIAEKYKIKLDERKQNTPATGTQTQP